MTRVSKALIIALVAALAAATALAAPPEGSAAADPVVATTQPLRVQPWHLLQQDGAELYAELCSSCHGITGEGDGPRARELGMPPTALAHLEQAGIPKEHWTYVIWSGCDDHHHWAPDGSATMPCWRRVFRQALGNEAAPLLVSTKLVAHLESLQK